MHHKYLSYTGVCEKYKNLGDDCSPFDTLNGHCGCKSGMTCGFVPASTTTTMKRKLYFPGPGAYLCKIADNADN
ncbi:hypothetical protein FSP39_017466 [Pinctada imbricata]|uniref:Uncharacterized protein n=1 Tax=Pinctada imbricata TaxID=66713 RepID=A0AA88XSX0_PINIB|nr:hypothetical protein FSP39_017466 [Pinctada imbricata]